MTAEDRQMLLFPDLPIPTAPPQPSPRRRMLTLAAAVVAEQLAFRFVLRELERDDVADPLDFPRRTHAPADAPLPQTTGPASIWALAEAAKASKALRSRGRFGDDAGFVPQKAPKVAVIREGGVVRVVGAAYPSRWDAEREEQERQRRARQKPPRPVKKARTRSKKLLELIGGTEDNE